VACQNREAVRSTTAVDGERSRQCAEHADRLVTRLLKQSELQRNLLGEKQPILQNWAHYYHLADARCYVEILFVFGEAFEREMQEGYATLFHVELYDGVEGSALARTTTAAPANVDADLYCFHPLPDRPGGKSDSCRLAEQFIANKMAGQRTITMRRTPLDPAQPSSARP
jgi:hypothetical protein